MKKYLLLIVFYVFSIAYANEGDFNKVLVKYESLHQAFFDQDLKKVRLRANEVLLEIDKIEDDKISKILTYSKKKLGEITTSKDLDVSKKNFNIISQGILVVLEKHVPNKDYARYYCSMEKKYWIQNTIKQEKVMNPYAPDTMPHCGSKK